MKELTEKPKTFDDVYSETETSAAIVIGSADKSGKLSVRTPALMLDGGIIPKGADKNQKEAAKETIVLDGKTADLSLGGGRYGTVNIKNLEGEDVITLEGKDAKITLRGDNKYTNGNETVMLNGQLGDITAGGIGASGTVKITNSKGEETAKMLSGQLFLGGNESTGLISLKNGSGEEIIAMDARSGNVLLGGAGASGDIFIKNENDIDTIRINGTSGDIEFLNADFAEEFDVCEQSIATVRPGTVMILDEHGKLVPCQSAYDPKVVGIIAGAGSYKSGIVMDKSGHQNRLPIAMMGKVYCLANAEDAPIQIGDMLTTSKTAGHAMKVSDKRKAFGTVVGKALSGLTQGTGLIPVLVNLQ